jgi:hypothetical protein
LADLESASACLLEHARGQVDTTGALCEPSKAVEKKARSASALENIFSRAVALYELDLEIVDERVIARWLVRGASSLVARRKVIVVRARRGLAP